MGQQSRIWYIVFAQKASYSHACLSDHTLLLIYGIVLPHADLKKLLLLLPINLFPGNPSWRKTKRAGPLTLRMGLSNKINQERTCSYNGVRTLMKAGCVFNPFLSFPLHGGQASPLHDNELCHQHAWKHPFLILAFITRNKQAQRVSLCPQIAFNFFHLENHLLYNFDSGSSFMPSFN